MAGDLFTRHRPLLTTKPHPVAAVLLLVQAALVAPLAFQYGPAVDEPAHFAAGLSVVSFGRFDLYPVNPPLVKSLAALPVLAAGVETDWSSWTFRSPETRREWSIGADLMRLNGERTPWLFALARLAVLPLILAGGVVCYLWGRDLTGPPAGLLAQSLYTFCPNMIGNGALITPDAAAASLGLVAAYAFWRWSEQATWTRSFTAGVALGIVLLTKFTWLILVPLWPTLWLLRRGLKPREEQRPSFLTETGQLMAILSLALLVVHAGYGFDRPLWRLGEPTFVSIALAGDDSPAKAGIGGNRFRGSWAGELPVPLPQMLVHGVDLQKLDFDEGRRSYMAGEWRFGGWHEFYLYAALVKIPLGTLALILMAFFAPPRGALIRWLVVVAPGLAVFVLVSSETGFTRFFRYALPALPFAFVWAGQCVFLASRLPGKLLVGGCLAATIASSLWVWPHSLSYFNESAGGPANGWKHLLDANIDWGQDLPRLADWQRRHPEATPLTLETYSQLTPEIHGLKYEMATSRRIPGWYAVSIAKLHEPGGPCAWLKEHEPVARVGYSMLIYHVPTDGASINNH
ncbi:MAG: glycosyltransferase family 39 protein [Planctomycetaceae bacterium]